MRLSALRCHVTATGTIDRVAAGVKTARGVIARPIHITLDLHNVRKMDCAGLGAIVACMTLARQQGKTFDLCFVPSHISNMIRVTGLYRVLHVAEQKSASSVGVCAA